MLEKKIDKIKQEVKPRDDGVELENQFILRLPDEPAKVLREAIQSGSLKDRMTIKIDNDIRYGEVRLDHWLLYAKVLDLPTVIECLKTIDNKSFYKSADICQIVICKEEPDEESEKESPNKGKKKDPNKVDKKYLWPHGITPPCKNVRKRRFRKTLKKKNVEAPEIEKEVKHLLRIDNEAVKVEYEIISEEVGKHMRDQSDIKDFNEGDDEFNNEVLNEGDKSMNESSVQRDINVESDDDEAPSFGTNNAQINTVAEHDIFGEELSSSDEDDDTSRRASQPMHEMEEASRLSADDSHMSDFYSAGPSGLSHSKTAQPSEFNKSMFSDASSPKSNMDKFGGSSSNLAAPANYFDNHHHLIGKRDDLDDDYTNDAQQPQLSVMQINAKISELHRQISDLKTQQSQKTQEIASIQNATLKNRMQEALDNVISQLVEKELELKDYETMLEAQTS